MILNRASLANDTDQSEHIRPGRLSCSWKASWEHVPREERGLPGHRGPRPAPWGRWTLPRTTTSRNRRSSGLRGPDKQKQREAAYRGASSSKLPGNSQTRRGEPADLSRPQNPQLPILYHPPKHSHSCPNQAQRMIAKTQISKDVPTNQISACGGPGLVEVGLEGFLEERKDRLVAG